MEKRTGKPSIMVVGAGAVGSLVGGWIAARGGTVGMLGRRAHLDAVRQGGLRLEDASGAWGEGVARDFRALISAPGDVGADLYDIVIIATRTTDTARAAALARRFLAPGGAVWSIQNGIGNWEQVADAVGWENVIGGVMNTGIELPAPGTVRVTVQGFPLTLGTPPQANRPDDPRVRWLAAALEEWGLPVEVAPDIRAVQWRKLTYNCALNGPATLRGGKYASLLGDHEAELLLDAIILENFAVASSLEIAVDPPTVEAYQQWFFDDVFPRTADHEPSMLAHLRAGKATEIESMNGAVARLAAECGIPAPANARVAGDIRALEKRVLAGDVPDFIRAKV